MNEKFSLCDLFTSRNNFTRAREYVSQTISLQDRARFELLTSVDVIDQIYQILDEDPLTESAIRIARGMMETSTYREIFDDIDRINQPDKMAALEEISKPVAAGYKELKTAIDHLKAAIYPATPTAAAAHATLSL